MTTHTVESTTEAVRSGFLDLWPASASTRSTLASDLIE